jgi:hypothetical protein
MIRKITMFLLCAGIAKAQNRIISDTIYGTDNKNTTLFFPNPIKKAITGNENFYFGYNEETPSTIGIFKATEGLESNLLVITDNGNIFSFIVRYKKDIGKANYFITNDIAVGNEKNNTIKKSVKETAAKYDSESERKNDSISVFDKTAKEELAKGIYYNRIYGTKDKIVVQLKNIRYFNNELYFTLILKNNSSLDYDINYLNWYLNSQNKKRNTTSQSIVYKYKYSYNFPKKIEPGESKQVVFVFDKFSINEKKLLVVELTEINGERDVFLEIPNTFINNAN